MSKIRKTDDDYYNEGDRFVSPSGVEVEVVEAHSRYIWYVPVGGDAVGREMTRNFARHFTEVRDA